MSDSKLFFHGMGGRRRSDVTPRYLGQHRYQNWQPALRTPSCPHLCLASPSWCSSHLTLDEGSSPSQVSKAGYFSRCSSSWHVTVLQECPLCAIKIDAIIITVLGQRGSGFLFSSLPLFHQMFPCRCIHTIADLQPTHVSSALRMMDCCGMASLQDAACPLPSVLSPATGPAHPPSTQVYEIRSRGR